MTLVLSVKMRCNRPRATLRKTNKSLKPRCFKVIYPIKLRDALHKEGLDRKCFAFSLRSATEILTNFSTRLALFAKNSPPDCFLTLRPSRVQVLQTSNRNQKEPQKRLFPILAGAEGLEPSARGFGVAVEG